MSDLKALTEAVIKGDMNTAVAQTQSALDAGNNVNDIVDKGLIAGMDEVGERFSKGQFFVPQMLRAAKTMQECMKLLQPLLKEGDVTSKGNVLIGTVKGDLHDIGKNLVGMMCEGAGFEVKDIGKDITPEQFVEEIKAYEPDVLGMSALLTTTMRVMGHTIKALEEAGVRDKVKVMIGGAPVTQAFADEIGADGYSSNAAGAADLAKKFVGKA